MPDKRCYNSVMELALTISAGLGALLFIIGYLGFIFAGFGHHFVTGIIAALPVLNIVTVPALWHKTSKSLMISILGIIIFSASWFMGGDTNIKKILFPSAYSNSQAGIESGASPGPAQITVKSSKHNSASTTIRPVSEQQTTSVKPFANQQRVIDEENMRNLPAKALYRLSFEGVPVDQVSKLKNRVIQLTTDKNEILEGRIIRLSKTSIFLQSRNSISRGNEFPIANIKQLRLMIKKAANK